MSRWVVALVLLSTACSPSFDERPWLVEAPVLLAIRGEPPEARPGEHVRFEALLAGAEGPRSADVAWTFCLTPRTLDERNAVSSACLGDSGDDLRPTEPEDAEIPMESCSRFGPNAPPAEPGQPPLRPADPDTTGGYYQPIRAALTDPPLVGVGLERVTCGLPGAPAEIVAQFINGHVPNRNPVFSSFTLVFADGTETSSTAAVATGIPRGAKVTLRAAWSGDDAETYPVYDPSLTRLVDHRESLRLSWFTTGGELTSDRTGRSEADTLAGHFDSSNVWTTPDREGPVWLWVVLRDNRGGGSWIELPLDVR